MINDYALYLTLAFAVTVIPGPLAILTIKNSILYGGRIAISGILGNFVAMVILASISALGLGAIIMASHSLFYALKVLGCLYLIYLGVQAWRAPSNKLGKVKRTKSNRTIRASFKEGFSVGLANPKAIAFITAIFPQFIDLTTSVIPQYAVLILTIESVSLLVLSTYAFIASRLANVLSKEGPMKIFNKLTAAAFVGFGLGLVYEE
ncbi:LysE family translocator [Vibrio sp. JC009]|uniref:LysE family translocator n=1 Tax=Vibrio sp. JC009 TaxID=2912314 RepID=UPI0023AEFAD2|nr:LysE family translocator [Vibrio sp. JC009]WED24961.1 LysE family translocator [Vibrio sp. JC009]